MAELTVAEIAGGWASLDSEDRGAWEAAAGLARPQQPSVRLLNAMALERLGRCEEALVAFDEVLVSQPDNAVAMLHRPLALVQVGREREAGGLLLRPGVLFPQRAFQHRALAVLWPLRGRAEFRGLGEDLSGREDPLDADFKRWESMQSEAALFAEHRKPGALVAWLTGGASSGSRLAQKYIHQAVDAQLCGDLAWAYRATGRAVRLQPEQLDFQWQHASLGLMIGDRDGGLTPLRKVLEENLTGWEATRDWKHLPSPEIRTIYALQLLEIGEPEDALRLLGTVTPEGFEDYRSHCIAALCWMALDRPGKAREMLDHGLNRYGLDAWECFLRPFVLRAATVLTRSQEQNEVSQS